MRGATESPDLPALPGRRGRFLPRRFGLASVLSLPRHGESGEDRWAAAGNAWALCDGASEGYDGSGWAAALARALVLHDDPREAARAARLWYHQPRLGAYAVQPNPRGGAYVVQPNLHATPPRGGAYAVQPNPRGGTYAVQPNLHATPPHGGAYAVQPNPRGGANAVQPNPEALPAPSPASDWLAEASAARGSFSTALVVRASRSGGFVRACARGDTVLFVRDGLETLAAFPLDRADDFGLAPDLVAAGGDGTEDYLVAVIPTGSLRRPVLCLATDALAVRVLRASAAERSELWDFLDRAEAASLDAWARAETASGALREDDLTLLTVRP